MDPCMDDDVTGEEWAQLDQRQALPKASTDALAELPDVMIKRGVAQNTEAKTQRRDLVSEDPDPKRSKAVAGGCPELAGWTRGLLPRCTGMGLGFT
eukprot:gene26976-34991_t